MSTQYADTMDIDAGEEIHIICTVKPKCGYHVPFTIKEAKWQLQDAKGQTVREGDCTIRDHDIDAFIKLEEEGIFYLRYIYKIADETWVDKIRLKVG